MFILPDVIKKCIESHIGHPICYPADCDRLAQSIRDTINETIGITTLKRIFGFVTDVASPRESTLDIIARYCDYKNYSDMKVSLAAEGDSDFECENDITTSRLRPGYVVRFTYLPDRKVSLVYDGEDKFTVAESENGSLKNGDVLTILGFNNGHPLIVSNVERNGISLGRYIAGKISGITSLEIFEC